MSEIKNENEQYKTVINQMNTLINQVNDKANSTFNEQSHNVLFEGEGISLLDIKNELILDYITNLAFFTLLKLNGEQIDEHPCLLNLVKARTYLEKIKPLELKLKYQIDKLIRAFTLGTDNDQEETNLVKDPLKYKPNPENLIAAKDNDEEDKDNEDGVYKAPKIAPVPFDDRPMSSKAEREQNRMKERAARSRLMQDLANDFDDRPEEQKIIGSYIEKDLDPELAERANYEEENFVRLQTSKKHERKLKNLQKGLIQNELLDLDDFHGVSSLQKLDEQSTSNNILSRIKNKRNNEENDESMNQKFQNNVASADKRTKHLFNSLDNSGASTKLSNFKKAKKAFKKKNRK
ncbi:hypothetical protein K502DRAFT_302852 [Neoconidiobolus thromboides FSU 785]|nr:hypothetical protein K502DRAFT_302852 [Neoconidiobolus thromboides FSU 785]